MWQQGEAEQVGHIGRKQTIEVTAVNDRKWEKRSVAACVLDNTWPGT